VLKGHGLNISDLAWGYDSSLLLSAAYDKTCKLWDVGSGRLLDSFEGEGFVQCVRFHPQGKWHHYTMVRYNGGHRDASDSSVTHILHIIDNNIFFSGTTRNLLTMMDTRRDNSTSGSPVVIKNDAMINSM